MTNEDRRQALAASTDVDELMGALDDPATVYVALRQLKKLGAARRGLELLLGPDDPRLDALVNAIYAIPLYRVVEGYYTRYDAFPFAAFTMAVKLANDIELAQFRTWKEAVGLTTTFIIFSDSEVAMILGWLMNQVDQMLNLGYATDVERAEEDLRRLQPDVVFMYEILQEPSRADGVTYLRRVVPEARIVVMSHWPENQERMAPMLAAGACGAMQIGPHMPETMQRAVREVLGLADEQ